jgi:hypothetical protein
VKGFEAVLDACFSGFVEGVSLKENQFFTCSLALRPIENTCFRLCLKGSGLGFGMDVEWI